MTKYNFNNRNSDNNDDMNKEEREVSRVLQQLHASFADSFTHLFREVDANSSSVAVADLHTSSAEQIFMSEAAGWSVTFSLNGHIAGVIEFSNVISTIFAGLLCGYSPEMSALTPRPLSEIEREMMKDKADKLLADYASAWSARIPLRLAYTDDVWKFSADEQVFVASYQAKLGNTVGWVRIILRMSTWKPVIDNINRRSLSPAPAMSNPNLLKVLGDCPIVGSALLGSTRVTVNDILNIQVGDVICLDQHPNEPIEIRINNVPKLIGEVKKDGGRYIISVNGRAEGRK
ncbi:MAG: FliM/FliN family flagellar motor switch protein [bacterium]